MIVLGDIEQIMVGKDVGKDNRATEVSRITPRRRTDLIGQRERSKQEGGE